MKQFLVCIALATSAFATTDAFATPSSPSSASAGNALFNDGVRLRVKGQWAEALDRFQRSQDLMPSFGALVNIGDCYASLDKPASAWGAYRDAENFAARTKDSRSAAARERADTMLPKLAHLTVTVPKTEGLVVTRGGIKIDPATYDTEIPVDHGSYVVVATAPGRKPWSSKIDIARAGNANVSIPELELAPVEAPLPPKPPIEESRPSPQRTVGIGLEIGGGALLAGGLVFGALTIGSWSSAKKDCPDAQCPLQSDRDNAQPAADRASTFGAISTVGVIAGVVLLAGGIVLHLTAPKKPPVAALGQGFSFAF